MDAARGDLAVTTRAREFGREGSCDDSEGKGDSVWKVRRPEAVRSLEVPMQHGVELLKALGVWPVKKYGTGQAIPGPRDAIRESLPQTTWGRTRQGVVELKFVPGVSLVFVG